MRGAYAILGCLCATGCTVELPEPAHAFTRHGTEIDAQLPFGDDAARARSDSATPPDMGADPADAKAPDPDSAAVTPDAADPDAAGDPPDSSKPACECAHDEVCVNGDCVRARWTYEAEGPAMSHETGERTEAGWGASVLLHDLFAFLLRGPYVDDIPAGTYEAVFYIRVGFFLADVEVAYLDVNDFDGEPDGCTLCSLATRTVRTADFQSPGVFQSFALRFENPGARRLEFRVFFVGLVDLEVDRVELTRVVE